MALPLSRWRPMLDPLIAEAKRRMRRRRVLATAAVVLLAALAVGLTLGLRSSGGGSAGTVIYAGDAFSLRYPGDMTRVDWCWSSLHFTPLAVLTTAQPAPGCTKAQGNTLLFPPAERLGANGVSVELAEQALFPGRRMNWNARVAGQPAKVLPPTYDLRYHGRVTCPAGVRREFRSVFVKAPRGSGLFTISAVVCGPDLAAGDSTVDGILAGLRLTG